MDQTADCGRELIRTLSLVDNISESEKEKIRDQIVKDIYWLAEK